MSEELEAKTAPSPIAKAPSVWWDRLERVAKIFSLVAIPIVIPISLAIYTARIQTNSQKETFDRDYVQLAVSVLKDDKPDSTQNTALRTWAVELLKSHSTTKFPDDLQAGLKSGSISFPTIVTEQRPFIAESSKADAFRLAVDILQFTAAKVAQRPKWEDFSPRYRGQADMMYITAFHAYENKSVADFHKKFDSRIQTTVPSIEKNTFGVETKGTIENCLSNVATLDGVASCAGEIAKKAAFRIPS